MSPIMLVIYLFIQSTFAQNSSFYANQSVQAKNPKAYALQPETLLAVKQLHKKTKNQADIFIDHLKTAGLYDDIVNWERKSKFTQNRLLSQIFNVLTKSLNITPPLLEIKDDSVPGAAFFEYDLNKNNSGKVYLNPKIIEKDSNKYLNLLLLIHETRHSQQLQLAQGKTGAISEGFLAAFSEQTNMSGKLGFSDFLTLLNEYEAFQFANYVVGKITGWQVDTLSLGTFASQYDQNGHLKIDLSKIADNLGTKRVLEQFNLLQRGQFDLIFP